VPHHVCSWRGGASGPWTETHIAQQEAKGSAGVRKEACERVVGGGGDADLTALNQLHEEISDPC